MTAPITKELFSKLLHLSSFFNGKSATGRKGTYRTATPVAVTEPLKTGSVPREPAPAHSPSRPMCVCARVCVVCTSSPPITGGRAKPLRSAGMRSALPHSLSGQAFLLSPSAGLRQGGQ
jgi:hypothetical protein